MPSPFDHLYVDNPAFARQPRPLAPTPPLPPGAKPLAASPGATQAAGTPPPPPAAAGSPFGADYEQMLRRIKEAGDAMAGEHRRVGDQFRDQAKPLMQGDLQYDLTPLAALVDSWTGSNLQRGYARPETGDERQEKINALTGRAAASGLQAKGAELDALKELASGTMGLEKLRADQDYRKDTLAVQREQNAIGRAKLDALTNKPGKGLDFLDRVYAKDYNSYVLQGGMADTKVNIGSVGQAIGMMEKGGKFSGPEYGATPEALRSKLFPQTTMIQERLQEAAAASLKSILGSAFTEREGDQVRNYAFNPSLPPQENIFRAKKLFAKLNAMAAAKDASMAHFEEHGTMAGFKGKTPSSEDLGDLFGTMPGGGGAKKALEEMSDAELKAYEDELMQE